MFVRLVGVFEVRDGDGRLCAPRGAKARAILAMLCQTQDRRRARRWLEARLWSDRSPEHAGGSLRQALSEIRKALGCESARLETDRDTVRLTGVTTDLERDPASAALALKSGREFLEGIDIADQAFQDWLAGERARIEALLQVQRPPEARQPVAMPARLPFVVRLGDQPAGLGAFAGRALADETARLVTEFAHVDVFGAGGRPVPDGLPQEGMALHVDSAQIKDRIHLLVSLTSVASGQIIWNQRAAVSLAEAELADAGDLPPLVFQATDAAVGHFPELSECHHGPRRANALIARALAEMFSYDAGRLRLADQLLVEAGEIAPSARIHAWRVLVRQIMVVERTEPDQPRIMAEIDQFSRLALELSQANPLVLSLVGLARVMVDANPDAGAVLARDALAMSPYNPYAHLAQAVALSRQGDNTGALAAARRGAAIAARTAHVHWWEAVSGLVALRCGDYPAATAHYEAAHSRAPAFRAAMRHLLFLHLALGQRDKAVRVYRGLLQAEPDFTLDRIRNEPNYPAVTLRRSGLLDRHGDELASLDLG
jgi:DNA-binding SARP family transcriptional activator